MPSRLPASRRRSDEQRSSMLGLVGPFATTERIWLAHLCARAVTFPSSFVLEVGIGASRSPDRSASAFEICSLSQAGASAAASSTASQFRIEDSVLRLRVTGMFVPLLLADRPMHIFEYGGGHGLPLDVAQRKSLGAKPNRLWINIPCVGLPSNSPTHLGHR